MLRFQTGNIHRNYFPPHHIHSVKLKLRGAGIVHFHQVAAADTGLEGMAALRIAGVDDGRPLVPQHLPGVNMAQRPVVDAGTFQVGD